MSDFGLTDEEQAIADVFSDFSRREVMPGAAERDETCEFPEALVKRIGELDGMGISVPDNAGGLGLTTKAQLLAIEQIAYGDAALASIYTAHYLALEVFNLFANDEQREKYVRPLAEGKLLGAFGLTEPGAGSDIGSMRTRARREGDEWVISGAKTFISNAQEADLITLFATVDPEKGFKGITTFAVPTDADGVSFGTPQAKMGLRSSPTYDVHLDDVRVPADAMIGTEGQGGKVALSVLNAARIDIAAMANGIALRALDLAVRYASERTQFGQSINNFQGIQLLLGQMDAELEAARQTAFWAAGVRDSGADLRRAGSVSKYIATETCHRVVDNALQIHGGAGYLRESEIERLYRDARVLRIYEGTSQIQLMTIAKLLDK